MNRACIILLFALRLGAATLYWDPNPGEEYTTNADATITTNTLVGYRVWVSETSQNYNAFWDVSATTTNFPLATIEPLPNVTYFCIVTAWNDSGGESDLSDEVAWTAPGIPPFISGEGRRRHPRAAAAFRGGGL